MIYDKLFKMHDIMGAAMKASEYKNQVMLNNIANNDTPGYKAQDVEFESIMQDVIDNYNMTGKLQTDEAIPILYTRHTNYKTRIDENNVDIESEMVEFYKNASKYDVITNSVINNKARIDTVLTGIK